MASNDTNETKIGIIGRMKLARQISLNKIEPAYKDAIERFGRKLPDKDKHILLQEMKESTSFSKWYKIVCYDLVQAGLGTGIFAASGGNIVSCVIGIPLSAYGAFGLVKTIASWSYPCYFPKPVHRIFLTYPDRGSAFHEAVHFMAGEEIIKNHNSIEGIAIAASILYDGGEGYRERLREEGSKMNFIASLFAGSRYNTMEMVDAVIDVRKRSGTDAAWDYLCFMAKRA